METKTYSVEYLLEMASKYMIELEGTEQYIIKKGHKNWRKPIPKKDNKFKITWLLDKNKTTDELILSDIQKILNKISDSNSKELIDELLKINISTHDQLNKMVEMLFEKAVLEPSYTGLYANIAKEFIPYYVIDKVIDPNNVSNSNNDSNNDSDNDSDNNNDSDSDKNITKKYYFRSILVELCKKTLQKYFSIKEQLPMATDGDHLSRLNGCISFTGELFNIGLIPSIIITKILQVLKFKFDNNDAYVVDAYTKLFETIGIIYFKEDKKNALNYYNIMIEMKKSTNISKKDKFRIMDTCDIAKKQKWLL